MNSLNPLKWDFDTWIATLLLSALIGLMVLIGTAITMSVRADNKIDHCYVEYAQPSNIQPGIFVVRGFIPWRSNVIVASAQTSEEAHQKMIEQCPVK